MQELSLNEIETSAIGEIANISAGNAATSLSVLVQNEVDISIPKVEIKNNNTPIAKANLKEVAASVDYVKGISGRNTLFAKKDEVKMIADLMMGSDGHGMFFDMEFSDIHLSALSEVMNQAMGASSTSMGLMLDRVVDISTPSTQTYEDGQDICYKSDKDSRYVEISFDVNIGELMTLQMVQTYPFILAKAIADIFLIKKGDMDK